MPLRRACTLGRALGALAAIIAPVAPGEAQAREVPPPIVGEVTRVRDGDTLEIGRAVVRLQGLAAPERRDPLGDDATRALRELVGAREVTCEPDGTRSRGRIVALCRLGGRDVGEILVRQGLARDCARYSRGRYADEEAAAAAAGARVRALYPLPGYCRPRNARRS